VPTAGERRAARYFPVVRTWALVQRERAHIAAAPRRPTAAPRRTAAETVRSGAAEEEEDEEGHEEQEQEHEEEEGARRAHGALRRLMGFPIAGVLMRVLVFAFE
jgi:hypothetical protein